MQGVMDIYSQAINRYTLSGPTLFSEIIDTTVKIQKNKRRKIQYFFLQSTQNILQRITLSPT